MSVVVRICAFPLQIVLAEVLLTILPLEVLVLVVLLLVLLLAFTGLIEFLEVVDVVDVVFELELVHLGGPHEHWFLAGGELPVGVLLDLLSIVLISSSRLSKS